MSPALGALYWSARGLWNPILLDPQAHRELQSTSGFGVRPARVSARQCATTRAQYSCVSGTTSSGTPASAHTWRHSASSEYY